jgi:ribosomal protein L30/L7E
MHVIVMSMKKINKTLSGLRNIMRNPVLGKKNIDKTLSGLRREKHNNVSIPKKVN